MMPRQSSSASVKCLSFLILAVCVLVVTSCGSGDLSRGKAERMLQERFKKDVITSDIDLGDRNGILHFEWGGEENYEIGHRNNPLGP